MNLPTCEELERKTVTELCDVMVKQAETWAKNGEPVALCDNYAMIADHILNAFKRYEKARHDEHHADVYAYETARAEVKELKARIKKGIDALEDPYKKKEGEIPLKCETPMVQFSIVEFAVDKALAELKGKAE